MITMKARYEVGDINLRVSNVTPRDADSYVLLKASDEPGNELSFALTDEQAERLELELFEVNRRRKLNAIASPGRQTQDEQIFWER